MEDAVSLLLNKTKERLPASGHLDVFCDFDGVLAPIALTPAAAHIDPACQRALAAFAGDTRVRTAVVSGRALQDVRERTGLPELTYAGNHGLEMEGPGLRYVVEPAPHAVEALAACAEALKNALSEISGVLVENKFLSLSVHYRLVEPAAVPLLRERFLAVTQAYAHVPLYVTEGAQLFEVRTTREWHKGSAVLHLLRLWHGTEWGNHTLPVYLGDDLTDEDAFRSLGEKGVCVRVGQNPSPTLAAFRLESVAQVAQSLEALRAMLT